MKCHYINVPKLGKVLIPGCWSVVNSNDTNDISNCTCKSETPYQFEKEEFNIKLGNAKKEIADLNVIIAKQNRIIRKLLKTRKATQSE